MRRSKLKPGTFAVRKPTVATTRREAEDVIRQKNERIRELERELARAKKRIGAHEQMARGALRLVALELLRDDEVEA